MVGRKLADKQNTEKIAKASKRRDIAQGPSQTRARISLKQQAYEAIKHDIITCALRPGEYINESLLSERLQVGRTPVHQAIDQLQLQGMVEVIPRKGIIVRPIDMNEILQIAEVRLINEIECARLAAERITRTEIAELRTVIANSDKARRQRDIESLMLLDRQFHNLVAISTKNNVLSNILLNLHERSLRAWFVSLGDAEHHKRIQQEHESILEALVEGNAEAAVAAMRNHVMSARSNFARTVSMA